MSVLAEIIGGRAGAAQSASQAWSQALADADHLAVLHAIWDAETLPTRRRRYRDLLRSALPAGVEPQESHREQWLHRTLRAAELAGLDAREILTQAVASRDLTGIRDIPAAIDARIRWLHGDLTPLRAPAWSAQVPDIADPEHNRFLTQLAAAMDDRRRRIGEHAAGCHLHWAVSALGPVPDAIAARLAWRQKAAAIGAYRELSGHDHPDNPVGPEPSANNPELRAAWLAACAALTSDLARESSTAGRHSEAEAGTVHSDGEHDEAVIQVGLRQEPGQESPLTNLAEATRRMAELAARRRELIAAIAERHSMPVPGQDGGLRFGIGPVLPLGHGHHRAAILQPPKPEILPSPWIQERLAGRDLDREAAD